jgi:hypothetical protein
MADILLLSEALRAEGADEASRRSQLLRTPPAT